MSGFADLYFSGKCDCRCCCSNVWVNFNFCTGYQLSVEIIFNHYSPEMKITLHAYYTIYTIFIYIILVYFMLLCYLYSIWNCR